MLFNVFLNQISVDIGLFAGQQEISLVNDMFFVACFIIDATVSDILKAETARDVNGEPIVQAGITGWMGAGSLIKGQFIFFSDGMKIRSAIPSYTYQMKRLARLQNRYIVKVRLAGFYKRDSRGFYFM
jgi:hypothetical protein